MGLDNIIYESRAVNDSDLAEALAPMTTGIMVDGTNSFRGKVYAGWLEGITGYSLYESDDWGDMEFKEIIDELKTYKNSFDKIDDLKAELEKNYLDLDILDAFIKVFELCLERGWKINAWY